MRFTRKLALVAGLAATAFTITAGSASALIAVSTAPGTNAPPSTLGFYKMTPFNDVDVRPTSPGCAADTTTVPLPPVMTGHPLSRPSGDIVFNQATTHGSIPTCWLSWSHGYALDVYATYNSTNPNSLTMFMPPKVGAFYLYAEPNVFDVFLVTATGRDGNGHQTSTTIAIDGFAGARYIGFYNTTFGAVTSITVSAQPAAGGFAVGEFGVSNQLLTKIT